MFYITFYNFIFYFLGGIYCEGCGNDLTSKSAAVRLSNDLFCSYNKNVRPVKNHLTKITVNSTIYIFNVYLVNQNLIPMLLSIFLDVFIKT